MLKYKDPRPWDLQVSAALAALTIVFTIQNPLPAIPVQVPLGMAMLLFPAGYTLAATIFPRKGDINALERVALSLGMNIALVLTTSIGMSNTSWGMKLSPIAVFLSAATLVLSLAAYVRRWALPRRKRFVPGFGPRRYDLIADRRGRSGKAPIVLLVLSILISASALAYMATVQREDAGFTEFSVLGVDGNPEGMPSSVASGDLSTVLVSILNREKQEANYTLQLVINSSTLATRQIALGDNETWTEPISFALEDTGDGQRLEFLLFKDEDLSAPYMEHDLLLNVTDKEPALEQTNADDAEGLTEMAAENSSVVEPLVEQPENNSSQEARKPAAPVALGTGGSGGGKKSYHSAQTASNQVESQEASTQPQPSDSQAESQASDKSPSKSEASTQPDAEPLTPSVSAEQESAPVQEAATPSAPPVSSASPSSGETSAELKTDASGSGQEISEPVVEKEIDISDESSLEPVQGSSSPGGSQPASGGSGSSADSSQESAISSQPGADSGNGASAGSDTASDTSSGAGSNANSNANSNSNSDAGKSGSGSSGSEKSDSSTAASSAGSSSGGSSAGSSGASGESGASVGSGTSSSSSTGGDWKSNSEIDNQIDSLMSKRSSNKGGSDGSSVQSSDIKIVSGSKERAVLGKSNQDGGSSASGTPTTPRRLG